MKSLILAAALTLAVSGAALAGQCQDDIEKIDAALAGGDGPDDLSGQRSTAPVVCCETPAKIGRAHV